MRGNLIAGARSLLDHAAGQHLLAGIGIGDLRRGLDPILFQHRAVHDVITVLTGCELDCVIAQLREFGARGGDLLAARDRRAFFIQGCGRFLRAFQIVSGERPADLLVLREELLVVVT